jgi:hypothetical protein
LSSLDEGAFLASASNRKVVQRLARLARLVVSCFSVQWAILI